MWPFKSSKKTKDSGSKTIRESLNKWFGFSIVDFSLNGLIDVIYGDYGYSEFRDYESTFSCVSNNKALPTQVLLPSLFLMVRDSEKNTFKPFLRMSFGDSQKQDEASKLGYFGLDNKECEKKFLQLFKKLHRLSRPKTLTTLAIVIGVIAVTVYCCTQVRASELESFLYSFIAAIAVFILFYIARALFKKYEERIKSEILGLFQNKNENLEFILTPKVTNQETEITPRLKTWGIKAVNQEYKLQGLKTWSIKAFNRECELQQINFTQKQELIV